MMTDYKRFCRRHGLDPALESSRAEYNEAQAALKALYGASAKDEAREAIHKAKQH